MDWFQPIVKPSNKETLLLNVVVTNNPNNTKKWYKSGMSVVIINTLFEGNTSEWPFLMSFYGTFSKSITLIFLHPASQCFGFSNYPEPE